MKKLKFEKTEMNCIPCYISGAYKVVKYGEFYFAYFKPSSWNNWGNSCEKNRFNKSMTYKTIKLAKKACQRHHNKFGEYLNPYDFIPIYNSI